MQPDKPKFDFSTLNEEQKTWILQQSGAGIFHLSKKLFDEHKINPVTFRMMNAYWLIKKNINWNRR